MKKNEIIELNGVEYTLELNRDSFLKIDQYSNVKKSMQIIQKDLYEYIDEVDDNTDPFATEIDYEKVEEDAQNKLDTLYKIIERAYWIWLYPEHKLNITQIKEILKPYFEEFIKAQMDISKKWRIYAKMCWDKEWIQRKSKKLESPSQQKELEEEDILKKYNNSYYEYYCNYLFPQAIEYGMSAEEFWKDDPQLFVSYRTSFFNKKKREMEEIDYKCWVGGLYNYDGNSKLMASLKQLISNIVASFSKGQKDTTKIDSYPKKPYMELEKEKNEHKKQRILYKDEAKPLSKQEMAIVGSFFKDALIQAPRGRIMKVGENIVLISHDCPIPRHSVFMSGVMIGEIKGQNLFPHHQLFSAYADLFKFRENLTKDDPRVEKYLAGEEISASDGVKGWCAILFEGAPLGGGKASGGRIKNHYPKGLRTR